MLRFGKLVLGSIALFSMLGPVGAETPAQTATLKLNSEMLKLYDGALRDAQSDLQNAHPVILARFTGQGGDMILYRPGQEPLVAERVPIGYELVKSVGHSSMAVFAHAYANLDKPAEAWREAMAGYRTTSEQCLAQIPQLDLPQDWKDTMLRVVHNLPILRQAQSRRGGGQPCRAPAGHGSSPPRCHDPP